jgi:hypothetical protein
VSGPRSQNQENTGASAQEALDSGYSHTDGGLVSLKFRGLCVNLRLRRGKIAYEPHDLKSMA